MAAAQLWSTVGIAAGMLFASVAVLVAGIAILAFRPPAREEGAA